MLTMRHDCPYCKTINSGFSFVHAKPNLVSSRRDIKVWNIFFECNTCGSGVICEAMTATSENPNHLNGDIKQVTFFTIVGIYPEQRSHDIPGHLPELVSNAFREGLDNLPKSPNAAVAMFRRALELGLKLFDPSLTKMNLIERIDELSDAGKITTALKEWAHQVRLDGNSALHDLSEFTLKDAEQLHLFTRYILIYLFTLPTQVSNAKESST